MERQERIGKMLSWFVKGALGHAEAVEALDEQKAAAEAARVGRALRGLFDEGEAGLGAILELLAAPEPEVAAMAAVCCFEREPKRCAAVLEKIAEGEGLLAQRAAAALELRLSPSSDDSASPEGETSPE